MRCALFALVLACGKAPPPVDKPVGSSTETPMNKPGSGSKASFVKGHSLGPKDKLVEWMEAQKISGEGRLLRVPIVLTKGDRGWDTSKAKIGELEVHALDGSLGEG